MPDKIPQIIIQQKYFLWENTVWLWLLKYKHCINLCCILLNLSSKSCSLRLVFTSDGVVVGSIEWYDIVKTKPTESDSSYGSVAYDQVKTALSESEAEAEE